jgi:nitroreductase
MSFTQNLAWRYAAKSFNADKKVSETDFNTILESIRMAPSAWGLQPYHLVVVESAEMKERLQVASYGQAQITSCDKLLVFCARTDLDIRLGSYIKDMAVNQGKQVEDLAGFKDTVRADFADSNEEENLASSSNEAFLALGFALAACAELQIDSCPMAGFEADKYSEILNLPETVKPVVIMAVGYRSDTDTPRPKTRMSREELVTVV